MVPGVVVVVVLVLEVLCVQVRKHCVAEFHSEQLLLQLQRETNSETAMCEVATLTLTPRSVQMLTDFVNRDSS